MLSKDLQDLRVNSVLIIVSKWNNLKSVNNWHNCFLTGLPGFWRLIYPAQAAQPPECPCQGSRVENKNDQELLSHGQRSQHFVVIAAS